MLEAYTNENGEVADEELIEGCTSVTYAGKLLIYESHLKATDTASL